jgi:hypothetical protein
MDEAAVAYFQRIRLQKSCIFCDITHCSPLKIQVDIPRTTRRYIPENRPLHNQRCENLKSYNNTTALTVVSRCCVTYSEGFGAIRHKLFV